MHLRTFTAALVFTLASLPVSADNINLTFTNTTGSGTVSLNAGASYNADQYLITSASGAINGLAIVSLVAPGGYPLPAMDHANDNLLFLPLSATNATYFDNGGISFLLFSGQYFNLYVNGTDYFSISGVAPIDENVRQSVSALSVTQTGALPTPIVLSRPACCCLPQG